MGHWVRWTRLLSALLFLLVWAALLSGQDNLAAKSQAAKQALAQGRFAQAAQLYSELVRALPDNPGMRVNLGLALHSAGRYREAIPQLAMALKLQPGLTAALFLTGMSYTKLGEPLAAITPLSEAVEAEPANTLFRLELADSLLSTGRFSQSVAHFRKLSELTPQDPRAWQGLGLSYLGLARQTFEALEKRAPDSAYGLVLLANTRAKEQQYRGAFALYRQALERNGDHIRGIHVALAAIYRATGHADWAEVEENLERQLPPPDCSSASAECAFQAGYHEQVIAMPDSLETLYWKNQSYTELAASALQQLLHLPPSPQIHELTAEALDLQGEHREAANELREALRLAPDDRRLEELLARTLCRGRDFGHARPLLEQLLRADPNSAELNFELGDVLLQQQEAESAIPWLEKAIKIQPKLLSAQASLARAYMRDGQPAAAIPHYQAALPLDEDGSLHFQLARACESAGNSKLAQQAMQEFQEISRSKASTKDRFDQQGEITAPPGVR